MKNVINLLFDGAQLLDFAGPSEKKLLRSPIRYITQDFSIEEIDIGNQDLPFGRFRHIDASSVLRNLFVDSP